MVYENGSVNGKKYDKILMQKMIIVTIFEQ